MSAPLADSGLPQRWAGAARFVVLDTCFGDGAAFLATWQAWQADPQRPRRLHYLALSAVMPAADAVPAALRAAWPPALAGFHRIALGDGRVTLDLMAGPADACLAQVETGVDAFYLGDPDAPACSAAALARLARPGATLAGPLQPAASQPQVLQALQAAGFAFAPAAAGQPPRARYASRRPPAPAAAPPVRRAVVIGAGVAGAAACERLCARGWQVTLIERHAQPAQEASGNLAGIFMPQLSRDDHPGSRLSRAAFLYALRYWQGLGGVGTAFTGAQCGVLQLARDAAHAATQRSIAAAAGYPPDYARWLDEAQAEALLGAPAAHGGWLFGLGGWAQPSTVCRAMLEACGASLERKFAHTALTLERCDGEWQVRGAGGVVLAQAPHLILANGNGATALAQAAGLPLAAVRGQVTHVAAADLPALPLVVCREAYMTMPNRGTVCVGATYDADGEPGLRAASQHDNLERLAAILGPCMTAAARAAPLAGRTGFRCVAPDRLPLVGALPDPGPGGAVERLRDVARQPGLYGLLGYASHGMTWAPLAAELLAARLEGEPLPLEASLAAALDPARFLLKARRRAGRNAVP